MPSRTHPRTLAYELDYADDRFVRLLLSRLIEPEDHLFAELREHAPPAELLRAIVQGEPPGPPTWPEQLAIRLTGRLPGLRLRLANADPDADLAVGTAADARFLVPGDEGWPRALDDLGGRAPFGVWLIGAFPPEAPAVAMVGARACTGYGNQAAGQLAAELARAGAVVVSGAAIGVDGAAHRGALAVGGLTVAVLACGIDRSYPATHDALIQAIGQRGAVLAELPPGTSPTRFRFLARNRLIAALGAATVVVEAAARSGSLVTGRLAAELGRAVFAVPGPITSRVSIGTNRLLCDGAVPAIDGRQILMELGLDLDLRTQVASATPPCAAPPASDSAAPGPGAADALSSPPLASDSAAPGPGAASALSSPASASDSAAPGPGAASAPSPPRPAPEAPSAAAARPLDPCTVLVREALPTVRSGRAAEVLALAAETGLAPGRVLAALGLLAARGQAVKTGGGWALG
ncbi:MAG TPA: DNA-processing protein DprA [Actinospica sp.]|nr:DNA-processing protein DprA [Actinospica sp.]